jgi:hemoglobin
VTQTIFERYGGFATFRRIVSDFYDTVLDSRLAHHFARADMRELVRHQTAFVIHLTGGPGAQYSDEVLARVHRPLGITAAEFDELLDILTETLEDHELSAEDVAAVVRRFRARRAVIVFGEDVVAVEGR